MLRNLSRDPRRFLADRLRPAQLAEPPRFEPSVVSVVIGSYNRGRLLRDTLDTVRRELAEVTHEILVVDGGSDDGTLEWLVQQKDVIAIVQHNHGEWDGRPVETKTWGYFMNLGFRAATGKYVCMLSDDCLVVPGAIVNGMTAFEQPRDHERAVGAVAFYWRNWPDQTRYWVGLTFGDRIFVNHGLFLREALEKVGYADAGSYYFYHADGDLSLRLWEAGYACVESPTSYVEHRSHTKKPLSRDAQRRALRDWETYVGRWSVLGRPERDWNEVDYEDPYRTAEVFWASGS